MFTYALSALALAGAAVAQATHTGTLATPLDVAAPTAHFVRVSPPPPHPIEHAQCSLTGADAAGSRVAVKSVRRSL